MQAAIAYLRTSAAANVEGDSPYRQSAAILSYAKRAGLSVGASFWDAAVSGADPIETRSGFLGLLDHAQREGVRTVLVEDASRFARSMIAQELGIDCLLRRGIRLVTASGQELSDESDPSKVMLRQVSGAMSQYEKAKLVQKLKAGRDRKRLLEGKCEGRKSHAELNDDLERQARRLARKSPKTGKARSLREIAVELATLGYTAKGGKPLSPTIVAKLAGRA